jgi:hypothetical protein
MPSAPGKIRQTAMPKSLSVKLILESGKELTIVLDTETWERVAELCPEHALFFESWAEDA